MTIRDVITRGAGVLGLVLLLGGAFSGSAPASAAWQATVRVETDPLLASSVPAPTIECRTVKDGLLSPTEAEISWTSTAPTDAYRVTISNKVGTVNAVLVQRQTETRLRITTSLLDGVLRGLLSTLFVQNSANVTVETLRDPWVSKPSGPKGISAPGILSSLTGGVACQ